MGRPGLSGPPRLVQTLEGDLAQIGWGASGERRTVAAHPAEGGACVCVTGCATVTIGGETHPRPPVERALSQIGFPEAAGLQTASSSHRMPSE